MKDDGADLQDHTAQCSGYGQFWFYASEGRQQNAKTAGKIDDTHRTNECLG
jgi:hypothetical protein